VESTDDKLVERCRSGDNAAFDALVKRYQRQVFALCYRTLGNRDEAADITQESFVKAYHALGTFHRNRSFLSWMCAIAGNTCIDALRRRARRPSQSLEETVERAGDFDSGDESPEQTVASEDFARRLRQAVLGLPERYRDVIAMFHFGQAGIREIARRLGKPEGTIKSDLHTARRMLREVLEGMEAV